LKDADFDFVTALSVWTHFNEQDALFYLQEVRRVLKPGGKAMITFFVLDEIYQKTLGMRSDEPGRYHGTSQKSWIFDRPAHGSDAWFCPSWVNVPEEAIGVTPAGLDRLMATAELELVEKYRGNWKEVPGVFFQDILVFQKPCE
jgi:SAM-dependent methyltransferase